MTLTPWREVAVPLTRAWSAWWPGPLGSRSWGSVQGVLVDWAGEVATGQRRQRTLRTGRNAPRPADLLASGLLPL